MNTIGVVTNINDATSSTRRSWFAPVLIVGTAAVVMGLPTLGGSFVGGDDHRLVLNHVLVNHPSFAHAVKLFTIFHRDLYQPLPLLSFQVEFAIAKMFGLFDEGIAGGTWLFHLTNIILHAVNAMLVWAVVRMLHERVCGSPTSSDVGDTIRTGIVRRRSIVSPISKEMGHPSASVVAIVTALLFAVHPLQTEVVAWTNGRMMLLSTLFALLSLLSFSSWLDQPRPKSAVLTVVFVLLSAISKVRIGLPVLLLIVALARMSAPSFSEKRVGDRYVTSSSVPHPCCARMGHRRRFILLWLLCTAVTAVFAVVNLQATAGAELFSEAAEHLKGPRTVRVLLALACYFQHLVWPVGLASYYPTPPVVHWSDPGTWRAVMIAVPGLIVLAWACRQSRVARLGTLWFFATIAVTLPFFPARNILAADRYMYLPMIGLLWLGAALGCALYDRWLAAGSPRFAKATVGLLAVIVLPACVAMCWHVARFYATPLRKTHRIAELFPTTPRVWERVGWSYYRVGDYAKAIECARNDLRYDSAKVRSGAYQLMGMGELRRGNREAALELLHKATEVDPKNSLGFYRLAMAYDELGRLTEALPFYEAAAEAAPSHNPTINRLASVYRRRGRPARARAMYEKELENNPYDVPATMALAELDIEEASRESYLSAEKRLETLLGWMPENTAALTNLGVVLVAQGRTGEAIETYKKALAANPNEVTAWLNLAQLYHSLGDDEAARRLFEQARAAAITLMEVGPKSPSALAILAYMDLVEGHYEDATTQTEALCKMGDGSADARRRLLRALERFDQSRPDIPWTFCLAAQVLMVNGNLEGAKLSIDLCEQRCNDAPCREQVRSLRSQLSAFRYPTPRPILGRP